MSKPNSLVLITVDCLRADHVGFIGYKRPTTPFLDSLAVQGQVLTNAIVAGAPTYHSAPVIMASRYPLALGRDTVGVALEEPTLASTLSQIGFATAAFVAANPYLSSRFGYAAGFETFRDFLECEDSLPRPETDRKDARLSGRINRWLRDLNERLGPLGFIYEELYFRYGLGRATQFPVPLDQLGHFPAADVLVGQASDWLRGIGGRPFFLWLHFMDPHAPYYPPEAALELMDERISPAQARTSNSYWTRGNVGSWRLKRHRGQIIRLYDAGIRWVDEQVSTLVGTLKKLHLWDGCVFALTADHGEEFLDHGGTCHTPPKVTEELVHVPLLLRVPGAQPGRVSSPFSLLDLAPTVLDALQLVVPAEFHGRSRWPQLQKGDAWEDPAIVECVQGCVNPFRSKDRYGPRILAVREQRYKLVVNFYTRSDELFDLEADPGEQHPLPANSATPIRRRLLERAHAHILESVRSRNQDLRLRLLLRNLSLEITERA